MKSKWSIAGSFWKFFWKLLVLQAQSFLSVSVTRGNQKVHSMFTWAGEIGTGWSICFKYSLSSKIFFSPPPGLCLTLSMEPTLLSAFTSIFWLTIWKIFDTMLLLVQQTLLGGRKVFLMRTSNSKNVLAKRFKSAKITHSNFFRCFCVQQNKFFTSNLLITYACLSSIITCLKL